MKRRIRQMSWESKFKDNLLQILYRVDQPRDEKGRWTSGGAGGSATDDVEAKIQAKEAEIAGNSYETGIAFDKEGNELFRVKGDETSVSFTRKEKDQLKDNILTHNHPTDVSFSINDIQFMITTEMAEMRVVTDTAVYSIKPNPDWAAKDRLERLALEMSVTRDYSKVVVGTHEKLRPRLVKDPTYDLRALENEMYHMTWSQVVEMQGMEYKRTPRG
jgi:hypothetical protein